MPRKTFHKKITSEKLLKKVNKKNIELMSSELVSFGLMDVNNI